MLSQQGRFRFALLLVVLLFSIASAAFSPSQAEAAPERRFGFGFIYPGSLLARGYSANAFFDAMFLAPPYPSAVQFIFDQGHIDWESSSKRNFLLTVMSRASAYPNIKIGLNVGFGDAFNEAQWTSFENFLNILAADPNRGSIGYLGIDHEHFSTGNPITTGDQDVQLMNRAKALIEARGFQFVSYYAQGFKGTTTQLRQYLWTAHTNFPNGDHEGVLNAIGPEIVGITVGLDGKQIFPSPGCEARFNNRTPAWNLIYFPEGYLPPAGTPGTFAACRNVVTSNGFQPSIPLVLEKASALSIQYRQYTFYITGNSATDHDDASSFLNFLGVSGISTYFLWDHPIFRNVTNNWLLENPGVYIQGTSPSSQYSVTVNPNGGRIYVDSSPVTTQTVFNWIASSTHTLDPDSGYSPSSGTRLMFTGWSDGNSQDPRSITVTTAATYAAQWQTQYQLTIGINPANGGSTNPAVGSYWHNAGTATTITQTSNSGFSFNRWLLDGSGVGSGSSYQVTMNLPHTLNAEFTSQQPPPPPPPDLRAYYSFSEGLGSTASDSSSNGNTGQLINTPVWTSGRIGSALRFNGLSSYVTVSASSTLDISRLTMLAWVYPTAYPSSSTFPNDHAIILSKEDSYQVAIFNDGTLRFAIRTSTQSWDWSNTNVNVPLNGWSHIAVTFDGSVAMAYVNSNQVYQVQMSGTIVPSSYPLGIASRYLTGTRLGQWGGYFTGTMDEVKIYSRALTANEISNEYSGAPQVTYSITVNPGGGRIYVDGSPITTTTSYTWQSGSTHTLDADSGYSPSAGTRLQFSSWSDGSTSDPRTITVTSSTTFTAQWTTQYYLTVNSQYGSPSGSNWYNSGTTASFSVTSPVDHGNGTRRLFQLWTGDMSSTSTSSSIAMNSPKTITAQWQKQYRLTVSSQYGSPQGSNWYNAGLTASFSVNSPVDHGNSTRRVFLQWSGDSVSTSPGSSITMNAPKTITAQWQKQYQLTIAVNPANGGSTTPAGGSYWYNAGNGITVSQLPNSGYSFSRWVLNSVGVGSSSSYTVNMNSPNTLTAEMTAQGPGYAIIINPNGGSVLVDGVAITSLSTFNWQSGTSHTLDPDSGYTYAAGSRLIFVSWIDGNNQDPRTITATADVTYAAQWKTQHRLKVVSPFGIPQGDGWYDEGATASFGTVTYVEHQNRTRRIFQQWSGDYSGSPASSTIVMDGPKTITAEWETRYEIIIAVSPSNAGSTNPAVGSDYYASGSTIIVSQTPNSGFTFSKWNVNGADSTNIPTFVMTLSSPFTLTAIYTTQSAQPPAPQPSPAPQPAPQPPPAPQNLHTVTVNPQGGRIYVDGTPITASTSYRWSPGSVHLLEADTGYSPSDGSRYAFLRWSDGLSQPARSVYVTADSTYSVVWSIQRRLVISISPFSSGTTSPSPGEHWLNDGASLSINAIPISSYQLGNWVVDGVGAGSTSTISILMNRPHNVQVLFRAASFIQVAVDPAGGTMFIDGQPINSAVTYSWKEGSNHSLQVLPEYTTAPGTRQAFVRWSDGSTSPARTVIAGSAVQYAATWKTQHYVDIKSGAGTISPASGWYDAGQMVQIKANPLTLGDTRYVFTSWTGSGPGSYSGQENPTAVTVEGPIVQTALWKKQFFIVVESPVSGATKGGWYDAGANVNLNATSFITLGNGTRFVALGYSIDGQPTVKELALKLQIESPRIIKWQWARQYLLDVKVLPGNLTVSLPAGWYNVGESVLVSASIVNGYLPQSVLLDGRTIPNNSIVSMNTPHLLTVLYNKTGFTMKVEPSSRIISYDRIANYSITIEPINGLDRFVTLNVSGLPKGVTAIFDPATGMPPFKTQLRFTASDVARTGRYRLNITATSPWANQTQTAELVIPDMIQIGALSSLVPNALPPPELMAVILAIIAVAFVGILKGRGNKKREEEDDLQEFIKKRDEGAG